MIFLKSEEQIDIMDHANRIVHDVLGYAELIITSGMTTGELDALLEERMSKAPEAKSAFRGYRGYKHVSCISINEEIVHGVPGSRVIKDGDIVSVDFGVYYKGLAGDAARTFIVGPVDDKTRKLVEETRRGLLAGIEQMRVGNRLHDIAKAIDEVAKANGFGNTRGYCGHGIGKRMHEDPHVFNYIEPAEPNVRLKEGMVFALEPMFSLGSSESTTLEDKWTVITKDKSLACHWELSVAITKNGPRILGL